MDTQNSFKTLLTTARFSAKARDAIVEFCCDSISELANLPPKDLDQAINNLHKALATQANARDQVRLNATKCISLHSIRLHFLDRINCGAGLLAPKIIAIDRTDLNTFRSDYLEATLYQEDTKGLSTVTITKLVTTKWNEFKSTMTESLSRITGKNKIPLTYLIRDEDVGNFDATYDNRTDRLVQCITLSGAAYKHDNGDLYSLLIQHTEGSEGYAIVEDNEKRRNGRKAWKDMLKHFEGSTFKERTSQEAAGMLRNASYSGPRRNFTFGDYYFRHAKAHIMLQKFGKGMTVEQQIDTFIQGIQCAVAQGIVVNVAGDPVHRSTFDTYYNIIASKLELSISLSNKPTSSITRNVNQVNFDRERKTNSQNNKRTGNGNNSKYNNKKSKPGNQFVPEARRYSAQEWKALSKDQQAQIKSLHKAARTTDTRTNERGSHTQHSQASNSYQANSQYRPVNQVRYTQQMASIPNTFYQPQYHQGGQPPCVARSVNQVMLPPPPPNNIPPPPPGRSNNNGQIYDHVSAMSGEVGQSWGANPNY